MKIYFNMPREFVDGWAMSTERHDAGEPVPFHYHDVEEWLQVQTGEICFVSAGGRDYRPSVGQVLQIPRGEVHRVEFGPNGVEYQMWVPVAVRDQDFAKLLNDEDVALIEKNLAVPQAEDSGNTSFFNEFLSGQLMFRAASGKVLDKSGFIGRGFTNRSRIPSDSVRVLHKSSESVLLSTAVAIPGTDGPPQLFSNERLFVREEERLRCRVWLNYPELVAP
jgi:hypothetical protein